ncbi:cobalt-precorrin-5B (C(1))-methyltransferase CbiD [Cyanobium sp. FGCU-6]|nr:cobalt-precorrin-5B (C(1))-methyltransferase CbiD [Cyanobium sp. FGCU6]
MDVSAPNEPVAPDPGPAGFTLPVWVAAAARAALGALLGHPFNPQRQLELLEPPGMRPVAVRAAALLVDGWALGEAVCDPGDRLDLTRGLVVWVLACWHESPAADGADPLLIEAGEGVGVRAGSADACVSDYARRLLRANLRPLLPPGRGLRLKVVLPAGRVLAERTSNAAFGVVDGLALIGTRAEVQAGADPDQLGSARDELAARAAAPGFGGDLVLVIGENGLDLAPRCGLPPALLLKAGNWLGPLLVAAAQQRVQRLLLFGVQGKLVKLAGGIFHTHHHLADGRAEVLTALAALEGLAGSALADLYAAPTTEAALAGLDATDPELAERLRRRLAVTIEDRCRDYLARHGETGTAVGAVLFDRSRRIRAAGPIGGPLLETLGGAP